MKKLITISILGFILGFTLTAHFNKPQLVQATQCKHENAECEINQSGHNCCAGLTCVPFNAQSGNGKCQPIDPTITNSPEPTVTGVEPTKEPEVTPDPCDGECEPTPEVTEEPKREEPHQNVSEPDHNSAGNQSGPVCTVEVPKQASNPHYSKSDGAVVINWSHDGTNISKWSINYGYDQNNMFMGIPSIEKDAREVTINGLQNKTTWVAICGYNGDSCSSCTVFDP